MSNNYFQFKHFIVRQDKSSMKVGTDGCLLGSWCPLQNPKKILDVGSGSGLISLMIAQRLSEHGSRFHIDAIEIDNLAYEQSLENFNASLWREFITAIHADFLDFPGKDYDLIVCNPPFYKNSLSCPDYSRNLARNEAVLPFKQLIEKASCCLSSDGSFAVIIPFDSFSLFKIQSEEFGLNINRVLFVYSTPNKKCKRVVVVLSKKDCIAPLEERIIIQNNGDYTAEFRKLMQKFYLWA